MKYLLLAVVALCASPVFARYAQPDLKNVPVNKLIANLSEQAKRKPDNANVQHHLARTHAMSYSKKLADDREVSVRSESGEVWFGYEPNYVPFSITVRSEDAETNSRAEDHLKQAIACYKRSLELKPNEPTVQLGYGWCLSQAGKKQDAIEAFRIAITQFWKSDGKRASVFGPVATREAAGYLIPLLDKADDEDEIADLESKVRHLQSLPRAVTPIAISLDCDIQLNQIVDDERTVEFDADGSGQRLRWTWITPKAGWLVYDEDNNGQIDSAIQMFGNRTFMLFLNNGYEAMALLDENDDAILSGTELDGLAIWVDSDRDGISDQGEVKPLTEFGIVGLKTKFRNHSSGIPFCNDGVLLETGETRSSYDVLLHQQTASESGLRQSK